MYCHEFLQFCTHGSQLAFHHQTNSISGPTHFIPFLEICACILGKGKGFKLLNLLPKGLQCNPQSVDLCLSLPLRMYPPPPCYLELLLLNSYVYVWLFTFVLLIFFPLWESLASPCCMKSSISGLNLIVMKTVSILFVFSKFELTPLSPSPSLFFLYLHLCR